MLIKQRFGMNNSTRSGFETTTKRITDLATLVIKYPAQGELKPVKHDNGTYELDLSRLTYPYLFFTSSSTVKVIDPSNGCSNWATLRFLQHDDMGDTLRDPFNNSDKDDGILYNIARSSSSSSQAMFFYPGNLEIELVRVEYIKEPQKINFGGYTYLDGNTYTQTTSELPDELHPEIVDLAVLIASGIVENPDFLQLKAQKLSIHE